MEAITPFDLEGIKVHLKQRLQQEMGENVTCEVSWWVEEQTILVFIHRSDATLPNAKIVLDNLSQKLAQDSAFKPYTLKIYWLVDGGVYPLERGNSLVFSVPSVLAKSNSLGIYQSLKLHNIAKKLKKRTYRRLSWQLFGLGFGAIAALGLFYGISRPCVMGSCPQLEQSKQQGEMILSQIDAQASEFRLNQAKEQLSEVIDTLGAIPPWSSYYAQARKDRLSYEEQRRQLEALMTAIATTQSHQPDTWLKPQSVEQWQRTKQQFEEAIGTLPKPNESDPLKTSIKFQKHQYRQYLTLIEQRLQSEKAASQQFQQGRDGENIALIRQKAAQSVEDWQLVETTWQTAIQRMQAISPDTTFYDKARQLLQKYRNELIKAQSQREKEEDAQLLAQKAVEQAQKAEYLQKIQNWSQSVQQWQNALISLQQIPETSFYHQQIEPLIKVYQTALEKAQSQLQNALKQQELNQYLQNLCSRPEKICDYSLENQLIKVNLTPEYNQKVWQMALEAKLQGNQQTQLSLLNHLSQLEKSLQTISLHTRKTVELYHSDGRLMMTFEPQ